MVPVLKADGSIRICGDYKVTINKYLITDRHPIPRIDELFQSLRGGKHFTNLDLKQAYNQLELTDEARRMCAWSTHRGIYLLKRLPFGVSPATSIFQRIIENLLRDIPHVSVFVDDIIITGSTEDEHTTLYNSK